MKALIYAILGVLLTLSLGVLLTLSAKAELKPTIIPSTPLTTEPPAVTDAAIRAQTKKIIAKKIILVGDSTVQAHSGWGGTFCANHLIFSVACVNLARGGRSTFDYRAEGSWDIAISEMKTPGYAKIYVLIQFGHNDQPGRPGRSTDLYKEYPDNLAHYITDAQAVGAIPVLVTPLTNRIFKNGSLQDNLEAWAETMRKVAKQYNVPLVDLHRSSVEAVQAMGARAAIELAQALPPQEVLDAASTGTTIFFKKMAELQQDSRNIAFDYTHIGEKGAALFSAQVAMELSKAVPDLRKDILP